MNSKHLALLSLLLVPACAAPGEGAGEEIGHEDEAILGGSSEAIEDAPYQVSLSSPTLGHDCGGSILDPYHVLTARHCFNAGETNEATLGSPKSLRVIAGTSKLSDAAHAQIVEIDDVVPVVDGFDGAVVHGKDLVLLRLAKPLHFNRRVQPIALATRADERAGLFGPGVTAHVTGWGRTTDEGPTSDDLRALDVTLAPTSVLQQPDTTFSPDLLATVGVAGKNACSGDSGGPLVVKKGHGRVLAGIVSFGDEVCSSGLPAGFTKVSAYTDAIERALCEDKRVIAKKHGIAGPTGEMKFLKIEVPGGQREVNFNLFGGTGDVDMRIRKGEKPTEDVFDCKSTLIGTNNETCNFGHPAPGTYWIGLLGFEDYADVSLEVNGYRHE